MVATHDRGARWWRDALLSRLPVRCYEDLAFCTGTCHGGEACTGRSKLMLSCVHSNSRFLPTLLLTQELADVVEFPKLLLGFKAAETEGLCMRDSLRR
jgi:hypothetical protein